MIDDWNKLFWKAFQLLRRSSPEKKALVKIRQVSWKNYRRLDDGHIDVHNLVLVGPNDSGKSSVLWAIHLWASRHLRLKGTKMSIAHLNRDSRLFAHRPAIAGADRLPSVVSSAPDREQQHQKFRAMPTCLAFQ